MERLHTITYVFPTATETEKEWSYFFSQLLKEIPSFDQDEKFSPTFANSALPSTQFRTGRSTFPMVIFHTPEEIAINVGNLSIRNQASASIQLSSLRTEGIDAANDDSTDRRTISNLFHQLKGKLRGVDHTGINLPVTKLPRSEWDEFMTKISMVSNLYKYPGEDWPFIIPADESEYETDITHFSVKRTPKFEFVYDSYTQKPLFQFALETDLTREEIERIFPDPIAFAIPGLEEIFRSIVIRSPWDDEMGFRFDLYYKPVNNQLSDWATGEWLVKNGGRISVKSEV